MGKRPAASKATRGVSKAKKRIQSSSSNPKSTKFRSQYNSLTVIAKGGPSKKTLSKETSKRLAKAAGESQKILDGLQNANLMELDNEGEQASEKSNRRKVKFNDSASDISRVTQKTTASFASVWSNCTNASLNEFFQVWNPKLETHKDALAVIAGLSQTMSASGTEQSGLEFAQTLFKILSSPETPVNILTGAALALTFVLRKLPQEVIIESFDSFYQVLKQLMETYHASKRKTFIKSLLRCFSCLSKAHPMGKEAIESQIRKKINIAIRQFKVQDKIQL